MSVGLSEWWLRLLLHAFLSANMELWDDAFNARMLASLAVWRAIVAAALYLASATGETGCLLTVHSSTFVDAKNSGK
jgi:hypothetical protein